MHERQLVLALKGKLMPSGAELGAPSKAPVGKARAQAPLSRFTGARADVLSALVNLGFRLADAEKAVESLDENVELQQGVRLGLKALSGAF